MTPIIFSIHQKSADIVFHVNYLHESMKSSVAMLTRILKIYQKKKKKKKKKNV